MGQDGGVEGAELFRRDHDELLALLVESIARHIPGFTTGIEDPVHPLRRQRQKVLRLSMTGMAQALDARHAVRPLPWDWTEFRELGRLECRYERPLSDILRAPWAASRTIVEYSTRRADEVGLSPAALHEIAEVVIDWSDRISIAFSEGYNDEGAARAGEMETRRRIVLELVLSDPPASPQALATASQAARWRTPNRLRVLVVHGPQRDEYRRDLPPGSLAAELGAELCALLPEPSHDRPRRASRADRNTVAALGPPTAAADARRSAALARRAIELALVGFFDPDELIDCVSLELPLLVFADAPGATAFSRRLLAAVTDKPELVTTLAAWLACDGRPKAAAARLGVHPHTVSYRVNQLRTLLGPIVDDPERRVELQLATYIAQVQGAHVGTE
jgi:hypothetical protein